MGPKCQVIRMTFHWFIFLVLVGALLYFCNINSNGDVGRVLAGMFPKEFETLGLKKYLERISSRQSTTTASAIELPGNEL